MHNPGHYGAVAVGGAMIPDLDMRIPGIQHRGITHTVWFALVAGISLGVGGVVLGSSSGALVAVGLGAFGFLVGTLTVGAHLLADALTPMGVRPLEPVDDREVSLDVAKAANPLANYALLSLGIAATGLAAVAGQALV